ncbi:HNH/endonuclease VII fold putative polymorphic toxin [Lysinibacillus xylanilyticus]|uniref:HNH/endonuclease VII fold putative polymorphic toxin n=1 Tax=Lysinibacillus xylanilyticus TaxID=582475 RepID=UPI003827345F
MISDHLGTPVEAYDDHGEKVWSIELDIYGRVKEFNDKKIGDYICEEEFSIDFIPFRFQGQYADEEIGLYYNRFRYYDPSIGKYTQQDPIGLEGRNPTLYGYVADPNSWIDPFGLRCEQKNKKTSYEGTSRRDAFRQAKRDAGVPMNQQPKQVSRTPLLDGNGNKIMQNGQPVQTRQYHFTDTDGNLRVIQEHSLGHTKATPGHGLEPHFNVRPPDNLNTGSVGGTHGHYNFGGN